MNRLLSLNPLTFRSGIKGDLAVTFINGLGLITGILILYGLIARIMGLEALGEFLLVRRTAFSLINVLLLGMNIGLPFFISKGGDNTYGTSALLLFGLLTVPLVIVAAVALDLGILSGFPPELALPFFIFTTAFTFQALTYGLLRGHLNILGANLLQLLGTGIIPISIFLIVYNLGMPLIFVTIGLGTVTLSTVAYFFKMGRGYYTVDWQKMWQLLTYSIRRVPTFAADFILIAGVPLLIVSEVSKAEVAYVNSGISLIRLFLVLVSPLSVVLLPRVSKALAAGKKAPVAHNLEVLCKIVLLTAVPLATLLSVNASVILRTWLGSESVTGAWVVELIVLGLPFYLIMEALRSPIDAATSRGYNSLAHGAAALALLITFYGLKTAGMLSIKAGVISFVIGCMTVAATSLYYAYKLYRVNILCPRYLMTVLGVTGGILLLHYAINTVMPGFLSFLIGAVALGTGLCLYFSKSRSEWVVGFRALVMTGKE